MTVAEADTDGGSPPGAGPRRPSSRVPALDGLRGFALIGMLLWHAEVGWVQGGFARMTIFFALSGYLATGSWMRIRAQQATGSFRSFWWRRARRLLPVSFVGIAVAVLVTVTTGTASMRRSLGGDVVSVLGYVSNIRFWQSDQSYGELFTQPSLLQHYWTLSIEEQAFFVLPLLLAMTALLFGSRTRAAAIGVTVLAAVCAGLPAIVEHTPDAVWYSSIVRFGEFCGGVALALWTADRARRSSRGDRMVSVAGAVALTVIVVIMVTIPREAEWLYRGGMALVIVPTVALLAAASRSLGPATWVLSRTPLVLLGRWTFSIYVLHWPLFWLLSDSQVGLTGWQLATLRLAAAVAAGAVLHVLVERPLMASGPVADVGTGFAGARSRRDDLDRWLARRIPSGWWRTRPAALSLVTLGVTLAAVSNLLPVRADDRNALLDESQVGTDWLHNAGLSMFDAPPGLIPVSLYGGSTALTLGTGGREWLEQSPVIAPRPGVAPLGCGLVTEGARVITADEVTGERRFLPADEECADWPRLWEEVARISESAVALVLVGVWDTGEFDIEGIGLTRVGEPEFDSLLVRHLERARDGFLRAGVEQVQLATTPVIREGAREERGLGEDHPGRVERFNDILRRFGERHDDVRIVDLAGWVASLGDDEVAELFPDGVHSTERSAPMVWDQYLAPEVARQYLGRQPTEEELAAVPMRGPAASADDPPEATD